MKLRDSLMRASAVVGLGMVVGRLTGFVRDLSLVSVLGLTRDTDLAVFTLSVPDLLTSLVVGGAAGAVLIPEMKRLSRQEPAAAAELACQSVLLVGFAAGLLAGLFGLAARWVVAILAPGFVSDHLVEAVGLVRIGLVGFPLAAITMVITAALQSQERFAVTALATPIYNGVLIAAIWLFLAPGQLHVLAWAATLAAGIRLVSQFVHGWHVGCFTVGCTGLLRLSRWNWSIARRYGEALGAISLTILNPVVARAIASRAPGQMTAVHCAHRLVELALGLFATVITTVLFPRISALFIEDDRQNCERLGRQSVVLILLITLPLVANVVACATPIISLLFEHGHVTPLEVDQLAILSRIAMFALPASSLSVLVTGFYYAQQQTRFPFWLSVATALLHAGLAWLGYRQWGAAGLLAAGVLIAWLQASLLVVILATHYRINLWNKLVMQDTVMLASVATAAGALAWGFSLLPVIDLLKLLFCGSATSLAIGLALAFGLRSISFSKGLLQ